MVPWGTNLPLGIRRRIARFQERQANGTTGRVFHHKVWRRPVPHKEELAKVKQKIADLKDEIAERKKKRKAAADDLRRRRAASAGGDPFEWPPNLLRMQLQVHLWGLPSSSTSAELEEHHALRRQVATCQAQLAQLSSKVRGSPN